MQHIQRLRLLVSLTGPIHLRILHPILRKELTGTSRCKELIPFLLKQTGSGKHFHLLFRCTGRKQDIFLRYAVAYRKHSLQHGTGGITSDTTYLTCRCHIHTQHRVGLLQTIERELTGLDTYIVQFKEILIRLLYRKP